MKEAIRDINLLKMRPMTPDVSIAKFYRVSQKSHTVYATNIIARYCNILCLCNVIAKCFQYDDQFRLSRDPDYLNGFTHTSPRDISPRDC